jgi:hypothetical protein
MARASVGNERAKGAAAIIGAASTNTLTNLACFTINQPSNTTRRMRNRFSLGRDARASDIIRSARPPRDLAESRASGRHSRM